MVISVYESQRLADHNDHYPQSETNLIGVSVVFIRDYIVVNKIEMELDHGHHYPVNVKKTD